MRCAGNPLQLCTASPTNNALNHAGSARVSLLEQGGELQLLIDDDGPGIPADKIEAVFQPFFRLAGPASQGSGGSGLGLHIARELADRIGCRLTLENRSTGGLRARLAFPPIPQA